MDGFSENTALPNRSEGVARTTEADRRYLSRKGPAHLIAILQTAALALAVVCEFDAAGTISAGVYISSVITITGFAIAAFYWASTWSDASSIGNLCEELMRRGMHVAALVFATTAASFLLNNVEAYSNSSIRLFVLLIAIAWAGAATLSTITKWRSRRGPRCVMVFGDGKTALTLMEQIRREMPDTRVCIWPVSALPPTTPPPAPTAPLYAHPTIVELAPDVALITAITSNTAMASVTSQLAPFGIDVLVDDPHRGRHMPGAIVTFAGLPFLRIFPKPLAIHETMLKRGFDILASLILLVLLSPLLCLISVFLKIDSRGPILFSQPRVGQHGSHFTILKFRTMFTKTADLMAKAPTVANDPRLTRFGSFLRKTSLDELPQLLNVLRGNMSLVGPRPHAMNGNLFDTVMTNYTARHRVKPGITGLAQVSGWRGPTDTNAKIEQRVANDLRYIGEWSMRRDISILCRTVFALCGKNAF